MFSIPNPSSSKGEKRKHVTLTLNQKLDIITRLEKGENRRVLMNEFNIGSSTIYDIKKQKDELMKFAAQSVTTGQLDSRQTLKKPKLEQLDNVLFKWLSEVRSGGKPVTGPMIVEKAKKFGQDLGVPSECNYSDGWLRNFKFRLGIRRLDVTGGTHSINQNSVEKYKEEVEKIVADNDFTPEQIYNADETGLLWQWLPTSRIDGIANGGVPLSQPSTAAEKPDEQTSRAESDIASPSTNKAVGMKVPASTHTSTEHAERYSKLKKSKSIRKCTETVSMKNVRVKNFIKSYGTAILTGIDALPPDVAIEFSVNVLKELNKKILETSLKEDENDNESVYSLCSATEEDENEEPDDSETDVEMDANSIGGVTHKDNETSNRFLDTTIKIESDVSVDNAHNP